MSVQFDAAEPHINYFLFWRLIMVRLVRKEKQSANEMSTFVRSTTRPKQYIGSSTPDTIKHCLCVVN